MANGNIKVGLIGAGANTRLRHIPGFQAIEGVELAGVCNRTRESALKVAREFRIANVYDHWPEMMADPAIDAICIGTWPYMHAPLTIAALEAGKHVLCEARMAMNAAEAHAMLAAARKRPDRVAQLVPAPMTLGVDGAVRRLVAEGYLGRPLAIEVRAGGAFIDSEAPAHWRGDPDLSGMNIMSLGIWYEIVQRWLGDATRVMAMGRTFVPMRRDADGKPKPQPIPDHIEVMADMACGAMAHFQVSSVTGLAGEPSIMLHGSEGTLGFLDSTIYGGRKGEDALHDITLESDEPVGWRVEQEFINAIRGLESVRYTTFEAGVRYMEFTEAVQRSMAEGRAIGLPLASI